MMFPSQELLNGSLVAIVTAVGQSSSSSSLDNVCVTTVTQSDCRGNTDVAPVQLHYLVLVSTASSPGSNHGPDTRLSPGTHNGL